jgi:hypothetical protein
VASAVNSCGPLPDEINGSAVGSAVGPLISTSFPSGWMPVKKLQASDMITNTVKARRIDIFFMMRPPDNQPKYTPNGNNQQ